jgi:hypothetical protein
MTSDFGIDEAYDVMNPIGDIAVRLAISLIASTLFVTVAAAGEVFVEPGILNGHGQVCDGSGPIGPKPCRRINEAAATAQQTTPVAKPTTPKRPKDQAARSQ